MAYNPLVVTDEIDSMAFSSDEIERPGNELSHLNGFQYIHWCGLPHRAVHIEIINSERKFFVWERKDGRIEIPGGHVDWITSKNSPETYEKAARRETVEELRLDIMWGGITRALKKLKGLLVPVEKVINQIPGGNVNNNEWVTVYRLYWHKDWPDPCEHLWNLAKRKEASKVEVEGRAKSARWLSLEEIKQESMKRPMGINAALRLFLRRYGIMVRLILTEYFKNYEQYCKNICPDPE